MKYFLVTVFLIVFVLFDKDLGYTNTSAVYTHFTYVFQHGSFMHLLLNSISFFTLLAVLERFIRPQIVVAVAVAVAVAASFLVSYPIVVVGASGAIYAIMGMYLCLIVNRRVAFAKKSFLWSFLLALVAFLVIGFVKTNTAGLLHLVCLVAGFLLLFIPSKLKLFHL